MTIMVDSQQALEALAERVRLSSRVGFDTEFHNERTYTARLMVVQLAFDDECAIVDALAVSDLAPLARALGETTVVGHALSGDLKIFADRFGLVRPKIFDCQVAAAFLGYGMAISLADLVRELCGVRLKKSQTVSDWSSRPFSEKQLEYLVDDVAHLLQMQDVLTARLREKSRYSWALEEMRSLADPRKYEVDERRMSARIPGSNKMSRRELAVLSELVRLRDRIARERDLPLKYIIPDDVVGGIAMLRPRKVEDLAQLRRLDAGTRRALGPLIVEAVLHADRLPESRLPAKLERPLGKARETLASLMSVVVGEIAAKNDLPTSLLVPRAALERAAREAPATRERFEQTLDLSPWRLQLVGEPLWRLLSGASALRIEGYDAGDPRIIVT
jgi:ribonuclease D